MMLDGMPDHRRAPRRHRPSGSAASGPPTSPAIARSSLPAGSAPTTSPTAIATVRPAGVDASSRLERRPGEKDPSSCAFRARRASGLRRTSRRRGDERADVRGRFDGYGGAYVPETLVPALEELEAADRRGLRRSRRSSPSSIGWLARLRRPADAGHPRAAARRERTPARRSGSNARTCSTPARTSSTTRSARCCSPSAWASAGSSPRPARASTGSPPPRRARRSASNASSTWAREDMRRQALNVYKMGLLGAEVRPVDSGSAHAQGRHQRGDPRLGGERSRHALRHRQRRRPAPVPVARAPAAARDRRRGARADAGRGWAGCPIDGRRLRRRRQQRDRHLRRVPRR